MIYLDNAATTRLHPVVLDAMMPYLKDEYGNAGSIHALGQSAASAVTKARQRVADLIGASPEQIIFTSGGTESNNLAIRGCQQYLEKINKKHIVTSVMEHDSVINAVESFAKPLSRNDKNDIKDGFYTTYLTPDTSGHIQPDSLEDLVCKHDDIGLVSIMYVNNEIGTLNQVSELGEICRKNNILFHTDCVQALGTMKLDVKTMSCDTMSLSAHKIHGPKGIGALYVREPHRFLAPLIYGGHEQEFGIRGGTENVASIVGFGVACDLLKLEAEREHDNAALCYRTQFYKMLCSEFHHQGLEHMVKINCFEPYSNILSVTFDGVDAETLILMLHSRGICVSAGSACRSYEAHPSRVLLAIGLSEDDARSTVRFSFSRFNNSSELEAAAVGVTKCVKILSEVVS